jgi:hypothetical protein
MTAEHIFTTLPIGKQALIIKEFSELFNSNKRGYGLGEFEGARFNEDKNKWIPGSVRWTWGTAGEEEWRAHLAGKRLLGLGVLCDDNMVWYACLDIDQYEIDYQDEMAKIKRSSLPLVVFRTKSGGLRVTLFFEEAIESELVIPRMKKISSLLGYAGCEIFPKQIKLDVANGDCPSWIYMPYGGTGARYIGGDEVSPPMFPEQGCMNEAGNLMDITEFIPYAKDRRVSKKQFMELFAGEEKAKTNGKSNGRKHPKGSWVQEESAEVTINTMFCDGPPCMWTIAHNRCHDFQNNFLLDVATFLKQKYSENWEKALEWVNYNVLQPVGDREKLNGIIKRTQGHKYDYMCQQEPICSHCNPHACRRMPWGVGQNGKGADHLELGVTIILTEPNLYIVNLGEKRVMFNPEDLIRQDKYQLKCAEYSVPVPHRKKPDEWIDLVNRSLETATRVQPSHAIRSHASHFDMLMVFLNVHIPNFLRYGEKPDDMARARIDERRVYFKDHRLLTWAKRDGGVKYEIEMRRFIHDKCDYHDKKTSGGRWWRCTYSISFDMLDEDAVEKWLSIAKEEDDGRQAEPSRDIVE